MAIVALSSPACTQLAGVTWLCLGERERERGCLGGRGESWGAALTRGWSNKAKREEKKGCPPPRRFPIKSGGEGGLGLARGTCIEGRVQVGFWSWLLTGQAR